MKAYSYGTQIFFELIFKEHKSAFIMIALRMTYLAGISVSDCLSQLFDPCGT